MRPGFGCVDVTPVIKVGVITDQRDLHDEPFILVIVLHYAVT